MLISFLGSKVDGHVIEYIVSSRGKLQLLVDGYVFYRNKAEGDKQSFYCIQYKQLRFVFSLIKFQTYWHFNDSIIYWFINVWFNLGAQQKSDRTKMIVLILYRWNTIMPCMFRDENGARAAKSRWANLNYSNEKIDCNAFDCWILSLQWKKIKK